MYPGFEVIGELAPGISGIRGEEGAHRAGGYISPSFLPSSSSSSIPFGVAQSTYLHRATLSTSSSLQREQGNIQHVILLCKWSSYIEKGRVRGIGSSASTVQDFEFPCVGSILYPSLQE